MNSISFQQLILQSPICKIYFAGFESNTFKLQSQGWQISVRQRFDLDSIELALYNPSCNLYAISNTCSTQYLYQSISNPNWYSQIEFHIQYVTSKLFIQTNHYNTNYLSEFYPADMTPAFTTTVDISTFKIFRPVPKVKEIIVGPKTVPEALEYLLKLQEPEQQLILEEKRKEKARQLVREEFNKIDVSDDLNYHAQLITIKD